MQHRSRHTQARSRLAVAATLVASCALAGCSIGPLSLDGLAGTPSVEEALAERRAALAPAITNDALVEPDTLTVGLLSAQTAPLVLTGQDGASTGLDVDVAHALADELGLSKVSFVFVSDADSALQGECDVVMGLPVDDGEDRGGASVTGNYAQSAVGLFVAGEASAPVDASALEGATVGVQAGSVSAALLDESAPGVAQSPYPNLNEAFEALAAGEVDYVACDAYAGAYLATALADASLVGTLDAPRAVGVAVSADGLVPAVSSALESIQSNGVVDVARARWVGDLPALTEATRVSGLDSLAASDSAAADESADAGATTSAE